MYNKKIFFTYFLFFTCLSNYIFASDITASVPHPDLIIHAISYTIKCGDPGDNVLSWRDSSGYDAYTYSQIRLVNKHFKELIDQPYALLSNEEGFAEMKKHTPLLCSVTQNGTWCFITKPKKFGKEIEQTLFDTPATIWRPYWRLDGFEPCGSSVTSVPGFTLFNGLKNNYRINMRDREFYLDTIPNNIEELLPFICDAGSLGILYHKRLFCNYIYAPLKVLDEKAILINAAGGIYYYDKSKNILSFALDHHYEEEMKFKSQDDVFERLKITFLESYAGICNKINSTKTIGESNWDKDDYGYWYLKKAPGVVFKILPDCTIENHSFDYDGKDCTMRHAYVYHLPCDYTCAMHKQINSFQNATKLDELRPQLTASWFATPAIDSAILKALSSERIKQKPQTIFQHVYCGLLEFYHLFKFGVLNCIRYVIYSHGENLYFGHMYNSWPAQFYRMKQRLLYGYQKPLTLPDSSS